MFKFSGLIFDNLSRMIEQDKQKRIEESKKELKAKIKFFKIEVTQSFWGKKVKYIQRDVPLTDEEVEQLLNK